MKKYIFLALIILGALNLSSCGDNSRATKEAEEQARIEAEEQARIEAEEQARIEAEEKARIEAEEKARIEAEEKARLEKLREFDGKHKWEGIYQGMYLIGFKFDVEDGKVVNDFALWETGGASNRMDGKIENGVFYGNVPYGSNECWVRLNLNTGEAQINWNSYGEDNITFKRKY